MITRVGIVAKPGLTALSADLPLIAAWLEQRGVKAIFDADTAALTYPGRCAIVPRDELPRHVDLVLLLG